VKSVFIIAIAVFFGITSCIPLAYSYEIIYPELDYKHDSIPNYCIVRPNDPELNDGQKDWMVKMGEDALSEWESTLVSSLGGIGKWQLQNTVIKDVQKSSFFNCDWTISFQPEIPSWFVFGVVMGYADMENKEIVIRYEKINQEEFHDILLHEIGHSLGLGHFTTEDSSLMYQWRTSETPPSIMIPNIHINPGMTYITDVDINKIKSIYGNGGFADLKIKTQSERDLALDAISALENLSVSPDTITIKKYQTNMFTISGNLEKSFVLSGVPLHLIIIKPDFTTSVITVYPTSNGSFNIPMVLNEQSPHGKYSIEGVYLDRTISFNTVEYWVENESSKKLIQNNVPISKPIPLWIKNNAEWWADGILPDKSFIDGLQYLLEQKIINIPNLSVKSAMVSNTIPSWIKNYAEWWADGIISDDEFKKGLEYLVKQGIIRI